MVQSALISITGTQQLEGEESESIDNTLGNSFSQQVIEGKVGIFYDIMQETGCLFFVRVPHHTYCKWVKDNRMACSVELSGVGCNSYAERYVYLVHNRGC